MHHNNQVELKIEINEIKLHMDMQNLSTPLLAFFLCKGFFYFVAHLYKIT